MSNLDLHQCCDELQNEVIHLQYSLFQEHGTFLHLLKYFTFFAKVF